MSRYVSEHVLLPERRGSMCVCFGLLHVSARLYSLILRGHRFMPPTRGHAVGLHIKMRTIIACIICLGSQFTTLNCSEDAIIYTCISILHIV